MNSRKLISEEGSGRRMHTILTYLNDFKMDNKTTDFKINEKINQYFVAPMLVNLSKVFLIIEIIVKYRSFTIEHAMLHNQSVVRSLARAPAACI